MEYRRQEDRKIPSATMARTLKTVDSIGHSNRGEKAIDGYPDSDVEVQRKGGLASLHELYMGTWRTFWSGLWTKLRG